VFSLLDISSVLKAMFNKSAQAAKSDLISQAANSDSGESKIPKGIIGPIDIYTYTYIFLLYT